MENVIVSLNVVIPLFALVVLGYLLKKVRWTDEGFNKIANKLCFNLFLPFSIFKSIFNSDYKNNFSGGLLLWAVILFFVAVAVSLPIVMIYSKKNTVRGALLQCAVRSNFVYIGLPVAQSLFGEEGTSVVATIVPIVIVIFNVSAVLILTVFSGETRKLNIPKMLLNIVKNPLIIAAAVALLVKLTGFQMPQFLATSISNVASLATPLALIALGGGFEFRSIKGKLADVIMGVSLRNVIVPVVTLAIAALVGFRGSELGALFVMLAAPVAVSSYPMALMMKSDGELAGHLVVFTTAASVVTLFIGVFVLKTFGLI